MRPRNIVPRWRSFIASPPATLIFLLRLTHLEAYMDPNNNLENMKKLDDSWNAQDLATFRRYHSKDCIVRWPNQPPTHGRDAHEQEAIAFFKIFPDQHLINNPYKIM